jgi:hypothetical protein
MPRQERHHLRAGLQDRHTGVEVDPVQALNIQRDIPVEYVVHRDDPLTIAPACAHRGAAATPEASIGPPPQPRYRPNGGTQASYGSRRSGAGSVVLQPDFVTGTAGVLDSGRPLLDDHGL